MRLPFVLALAVIAGPALAAPKTQTVAAVEAASTVPVKIGAVLPTSAQVIVQADGAYGIVIDQTRVLVVDPKSRKVLDILESGT